ncbi:Aste57867_22172 [Aphanomyces stellatus]|uniref:Aste57867_22172 protein n=1 Tax=Aphanomyces stellatus TaxID=120398 RepID=A0A485LJG8_9STRA|nr:hypothetical protein As57867_022103 [Aphanomyces stellatus]VFT98839.1 Aste57867_22172 [Aphanomyces stellatus]
MGGLMLDVSTRWSEDERTKFIYGLQQYGSDWNRIARIIDSKTVQEVYEYASLHYKTMMTGKDLRSLESMQNSVSLLSDQLKTEKQGGSIKALAPRTSTSPLACSDKLVKDEPVPEMVGQNENRVEPSCSTRVSPMAKSPRPFAPSPKALCPQPNKYEDKIKDLSDADIKMLLRKRLLDMQERRQENLLKRKMHESFANQQILAFQSRHPSVPPHVMNKIELASAKRSKAMEIAPRDSKRPKAPLSKKRKPTKTDFFAGVNALAMVSAEELQKYNKRRPSTDELDESDRSQTLQTPASQQCVVPWDFSIAPKETDKKRTAEKGTLGRSKGKGQVKQAQGDVLELAGFLSSLSQAPSALAPSTTAASVASTEGMEASTEISASS